MARLELPGGCPFVLINSIAENELITMAVVGAKALALPSFFIDKSNFYLIFIDLSGQGDSDADI